MKNLTYSNNLKEIFNSSILKQEFIDSMVELEELTQEEIDDLEYVSMRLGLWENIVINDKNNIDVEKLSENDDIGDVMSTIQKQLGVKDGFLCSQYLSQFDDEEAEWANMNKDKREFHIKEYIKLEKFSK